MLGNREDLIGSPLWGIREKVKRVTQIVMEYFKRDRLASVFLIIFLMGFVYITLIETEKYVSRATITIKNLTPDTVDATSLSNIFSQAPSASRDARLIEVYARSNDMFEKLDAEYNLSAYYTGSDLDIFQRLYEYSPFIGMRATRDNLVERFNRDLVLMYDDEAGTLEIEFAYADPKRARELVSGIIANSSEALNRFEKENAQTALRYLTKQAKLKKERFLSSIKRLINYQNRHSIFSPTSDVERKSTILATLESTLVEKEVEYKNRLQYMNKNAPEMVLMRGDIENIKKRIKSIRGQMASPSSINYIERGGSSNKELNKYVYDFELLKSQSDFSKELYTQTLIKLEELKVKVSQNAKNVIVVSSPTLSDVYTYPTKVRDIFSLLVILLFLYGIIVGVTKIIKDHKD
jgi:capsular polysaccharide transport system permease protein